ncbi:helix-turn-helix domain-containing protein [Spartinivicinus ruber]|uniref:helix-turn-helix domain-containing protein n=1 Tax=Spartinivicinus ruber TaxID=2683272 RepID=UPI0013D713CA|nr:helix-turn-helix domain-containing protein [Spartinivicinus ruber]
MSDSLGGRILKKRKELKITQKELAEYIGISHGAVSRWEKNETTPKGKNLDLLSEKLECSIEWILYGKNKVGSSNSSASKAYKKIPLLDSEQLLNPDSELSEWWQTGANVGPNSYAFRLRSSSMFPSTGNVVLPESSIAIVNPDEKARPQDFVLVHIKDALDAVIRQLVVEGPDYYLIPVNSTYKSIEVTEDCKILGVVNRIEIDF